MKLFFLFFLFYTLCSFAFGQNLIPNPSAEDFIECPSSLGGLELYLNNWQSYRGSPDYWNSCSENPLLGWNNPLGYQEPRTGEGYIGLIQYHENLENYREYLGINLLEPLIIGETYTICFYVSLAVRLKNADRAVDRLGFLLMEENYIEYTNGLGNVFNDATYVTNYIINDTTNWVEVSSTFIADSSYQYIAFGNFFADELTTVELQIPEGISWVSYYYFDDFCLSQGNGCGAVQETNEITDTRISLYPNPAASVVNIQCSKKLVSVEIYNLQGEVLLSKKIQSFEAKIELNLLEGAYIAIIHTDKEYFTKRFMVQY